MRKDSMSIFLLSVLVMTFWNGFVHSETITLPNKKPVIGILTQELDEDMLVALGAEGYKSFIPSSYVKYFESGGAQVIPVFIGKDKDYYRHIVDSVSGLVFPDGESPITNEGLYEKAGELIKSLVEEKVKKDQIKVPLMGISKGFQMLMYQASNGKVSLKMCDAENLANRLLLEGCLSNKILRKQEDIRSPFLSSDRQKCQLFSEAPEDVIDTFSKYDSTSNFHQKCISLKAFQDAGLEKDFNILSRSVDRSDETFISTVEHKTLPIYGLQWQPQMNSFELGEDSLPHDRKSVRAVQYVANFFVERARLVPQKFESKTDIAERLIYNFETVYTSKLFSSRHTECYVFK